MGDEILELTDEVVTNQDFRDIILDQQKEAPNAKWSGSLIDYMKLVEENPEISNLSPARIYNMIMKHGTEPVEESILTKGYEDLVWYKFFDGKIFGNRTAEAIHDIMRFLKASARRTETGKRILMLVGPVASAKSSISSLIKKGLERDDTPKYAIAGCPLHEEPLHAIPEDNREFWEEKLGVKIEGELCPVCQLTVDKEFTKIGDDGKATVEWHNIPVEMIKISEQKRIGIGTFAPSDPKSQDVAELIGSVNMGKVALYGESDPRGYTFDGELQVANGGLIEYIEILKADTKFHYVLITAAQEQTIKAPRFPQMYIDTLILSHTNQSEFNKFKNNTDNEALHDRMYIVNVGWNDRVKDEVKIYKKIIAESEFTNIHISPQALEVAAQFAVLSRYHDSEQINLIKKMKLYNGDFLEEFSKGKDFDARKLREEGKANDECMSGISPRFIMNALNIALAAKENVDTGDTEYCGCITALDMIRSIRNTFDHHIGHDDKQRQRFEELLTADDDSILAEYREFAKKEVSTSFVHAYDDQADELFGRYMLNVLAFCKNETVMDKISGEFKEPDEDIMRAIEEQIGIPQESKKDFRKGIFVYQADALSQGKEFTWKTYKTLKDAIEKKLMSDLKNVVTLSIADTTVTSPKAIKRRETAMEALLAKGYCPNCAKHLLSFVGEILRREN
jgi:serine protein kinase